MVSARRDLRGSRPISPRTSPLRTRAWRRAEPLPRRARGLCGRGSSAPSALAKTARSRRTRGSQSSPRIPGHRTLRAARRRGDASRHRQRAGSKRGRSTPEAPARRRFRGSGPQAAGQDAERCFFAHGGRPTGHGHGRGPLAAAARTRPSRRTAVSSGLGEFPRLCPCPAPRWDRGLLAGLLRGGLEL